MGIAACAILLAVASGCASTSLDDAAPTASATSQTTLRGAASSSSETSSAAATPVATVSDAAGPRNTGTFPNLNIAPQVANDQITDDEKTAQTSSLRATQEGTASSAENLGKDVANPALLRKLAAEHAAEALKKIQAQQ